MRPMVLTKWSGALCYRACEQLVTRELTTDLTRSLLVLIDMCTSPQLACELYVLPATLS